MYYAHFGLSEAPFKITPNTDFFFPGGNRGAILDALVFAVTQGEGMVKVTGEVGSGKTMLCRMLEGRLPEHIETVYLANPSVAPGEILHAIAFELHLEVPREAGRLEVLQLLQNHLLERHEQQRQVVIFVEEAQSMPLETLEEIRLLSNFETQHHKLLQIVLFGQPELNTNLNQAQIRQIKERITHSFTLAPLDSGEVGNYLMFRMRAAGYRGPDIFTSAAIKLIAQGSLGLTRRINIIADKALLAAFVENTHAIQPAHVRAAIKDSEFIDLRHRPRWLKAVPAMSLLVAGAIIGAVLYRVFLKPLPQSLTSPAVTPALAPQITVAANPPASIPAAPAGQKIVPPTDDLLEARLAATLQWLEHQPPDTFSIQLMGSNDARLLRASLAQMSEEIETNQIFVYHTQAGGKPSMTVLYGSYTTRAAANQAMTQLPAQLRARRPYLRTVQGVRAEITQAR